MSIIHVSFSKEKRIQSVMKEGPLMMKALSLSKGEALQKHATPHILYIQCLEGTPVIELFEPTEKIQMQPQQMIRIESTRAHAVYAEENDAFLVLHLLKNE